MGINAGALCTVREFCDRFNIQGTNRIERTRRQLRRIEEKFEVGILELHSDPKHPKGSRYIVNLRMLKKTVPAMFANVHAEVEEIKRDIAMLKRSKQTNAGRSARIEERLAKIETAIKPMTANSDNRLTDSPENRTEREPVCAA